MSLGVIVSSISILYRWGTGRRTDKWGNLNESIDERTGLTPFQACCACGGGNIIDDNPDFLKLFHQIIKSSADGTLTTISIDVPQIVFPIQILIESGKNILIMADLQGGGRVKLNAQNIVRHFEISAGATFSANGIVFLQGNAVANDKPLGGSLLSRYYRCAHQLYLKKAQFGGAIGVYTTASNIANISNCRFVENNAFEMGGAIYIADAHISNSLIISKTKFERNSVHNHESSGGALTATLVTGKTLLIESCTFLYNMAASNGHGGALVFKDITGVKINLENNIFRGNAAARGGAIVNSNAYINTIAFSDFENNVINLAYTSGVNFLPEVVEFTIAGKSDV